MLAKGDIPFRITHHKAVYTVAESSLMEGVKPDKIVKNILLKDDRGFFLAVLRGDKRIDFGKIKILRKSGKVGMATLAEVKEQTGVDIGTVNLFSYPVVVVDAGVLELTEINVHPDDNATTVYFSTKHLKDVLSDVVVAEIIK